MKKMLKAYMAPIIALFAGIGAKLAGAHICMDEIAAVVLCLPFIGPVKNWLTRCAETWRTRHSKPTCRHGLEHHHHTPRICHGCGMPKPDHDRSCPHHDETWSGLHHYALWSESMKAYVGCSRATPAFVVKPMITMGNWRMIWFDDPNNCPSCQGYV